MQVRLGALVPTLTEQGFLDEDGHLQKDAEAITRLSVRGILTQAETEKAYKRPVKKLVPNE